MRDIDNLSNAPLSSASLCANSMTFGPIENGKQFSLMKPAVTAFKSATLSSNFRLAGANFFVAPGSVCVKNCDLKAFK